MANKYRKKGHYNTLYERTIIIILSAAESFYGSLSATLLNIWRAHSSTENFDDEKKLNKPL